MVRTKCAEEKEEEKEGRRKKNSAFAGSRTRVSRLEGENANRYTTNAYENRTNKIYLRGLFMMVCRLSIRESFVSRRQIRLSSV